MKKRSCRRSQEEKQIHEQAIRIRKMTDPQLVEFLGNERKSHYDIGYRDGLLKGREGVPDAEREGVQNSESVNTFLKCIEDLKGIGTVTLIKLRKAAEDNGYI